MATISVTDNEAQGPSSIRRPLTRGQCVAIGVAGGMVPFVVAMAVVGGTPVVEAVQAMARGWQASPESFKNGSATLVGLGLLVLALGLLGAVSAVLQKGEARPATVLQNSLVVPALVFALVHGLGLLASQSDGGRLENNPSVTVSGLASASGTPVRIVVYEQARLEASGCFLRGLQGRGC